MIEKLKFEDIESGGNKAIDFKKLHDTCLVDIKAKLKDPPVALSIGEYAYKGRSYPIPFGTYGNFSCLVGASKSMKTFLKSALVAGYIGGRSNYYFPNLKGHDTDGKYILDIDTEQSTFHTQRVAKRVCEMVGSEFEYYKPFALREENASIRFQFIEWCIMESEYKDNLGLVVIDGAADILDTVNDLDVSNKIVQGMMKWTSKSNAHLCTILHRNHNSDKPTGHLGSTIMKKAETVAFVTKDENEVSVTANYTRDFPFEEFKFKLNDDFLPMEITDQF